MITRRILLRDACAAATLAGAARFSPAANQVLYRDYSRSLPNYLSSLVARARRRRLDAIAQLRSPKAVAARAAWARETFWKLIGGRPERTPLNPRTTGTLERPGYRIEKVIYQSRPNYLIAANLYIPTTGKPPYPGVLFQMGHSANGKAMGVYQACCIGLAKLGFVVLGFDPMGQGERVHYPSTADPTNSRAGSPDDEHTLPAFQMALVGDTCTGWQTWDSIRSLDYLASHPLVDPTRLGSTGQSGGGTSSMFLACADERLATAVIGSGNTENFACDGFIAPGSTDDGEQNLIDSIPAGFDRWDLLHAFAPKPLLVMASAHDFFGTYSPNYLKDGREEFAVLRSLYEKLGHANHVDWYETPLPHGLAYDYRLKIYNWFGSVLQPNWIPLTEEPAGPREADATLRVTPSGSLVRDLKGATPFEILKSRPVKPAPKPLDALLRLDLPASPPEARTLGQVEFTRATIEALEIPSASEVWLSAWLYRPRLAAVSKSPVLLALSLDGRGQWREGALWDQMAERGYTTCPVDVRGVGDLRPEFGRGNPGYERSHQDENHYAWASLILGKPLVGQRVTDILAAVAALDARPDLAGRRIVVAAKGPLVVPALFAAALEPRIAALHLTGGLVSFRNLMETEIYSGGRYDANRDKEANNAVNIAFGLLQSTDLPQVARSIAPRPIVLAGPIDAAGDPAAGSEYHDITNVDVRPAAPWSAAALTGWLNAI